LVAERILVLGAGMAGLSTALALSGTGRDLTLLERDPPPPEGSADDAFADWDRKGVAQLRHSHAFLARLHILIRDHHPDLLIELAAAGCRQIRFADGLWPGLKASYVPAPGDADLTILTSRRTTLEAVMRRYVLRQPGVRLVTGTRVRGLLTERVDSDLIVRGVKAEDAAGVRDWPADLVVDAGGRGSRAIEWLGQAGLIIEQETAPAGILYFTRHYRLRAGMTEPERGNTPGTGDLGYIKYGIFPADNGCFSITLAVPEIELELRRAVLLPEQFDAICGNLPGIARWTDPARAEPRSRVFGMGDLSSRWHHMLKRGRPLVQGFLPLGDSVIRTNPLYGRGCSFAAVQAYILRAALDRSSDPAVRAMRFHTDVWRELRPYYDAMAKQDAAAIRRARQALDSGYRPGWRARLAKNFAEQALLPAIRGEIKLMRAAMKGFHMIEPPSRWLKRPGNLVLVLRYWLMSRARKQDLYTPVLGPGRAEHLGLLGLSPTADLERLKTAA
jgi:2-polyprenyl-6-methoxyphenol hydroxylase-like FAD-dependent oxidoreductase